MDSLLVSLPLCSREQLQCTTCNIALRHRSAINSDRLLVLCLGFNCYSEWLPRTDQFSSVLALDTVLCRKVQLLSSTARMLKTVGSGFSGLVRHKSVDNVRPHLRLVESRRNHSYLRLSSIFKCIAAATSSLLCGGQRNNYATEATFKIKVSVT